MKQINSRTNGLAIEELLRTHLNLERYDCHGLIDASKIAKNPITVIQQAYLSQLKKYVEHIEHFISRFESYLEENNDEEKIKQFVNELSELLKIYSEGKIFKEDAKDIIDDPI